MKRRITLGHLRAAGVVRELEMEVDIHLTSPGYAPQFWADVITYGIDEAILYVRNGRHGDADAIQSYWEKVKQREHL